MTLGVNSTLKALADVRSVLKTQINKMTVENMQHCPTEKSFRMSFKQWHSLVEEREQVSHDDQGVAG